MRVAPEAVPGLLSNPGLPSDQVPLSSVASGNAIPGKFSVAYRLLRETGFDHVVRAEHVADKCIKIFFIRNDKNNARLGIIASKKIMPRAVDRNRIKRVIRDVFRQHSIKAQHLDLVVMVRHAGAERPGLRGKNFESLFSRVKSRCAEL